MKEFLIKLDTATESPTLLELANDRASDRPTEINDTKFLFRFKKYLLLKR